MDDEQGGRTPEADGVARPQAAAPGRRRAYRLALVGVPVAVAASLVLTFLFSGDGVGVPPP
ncbi:hypothetical protein, partial [Streptomyces solincola]|uniref:hypothetical protein n=1 Tax=Streptomyces solincola TaxID=2100817 RepID=UPI0011B24460